MKKVLVFIGLLIGVVVGGCLLSGLVNWLVVDFGRMVLGVIIGGIIIFAFLKNEFDE